MLRLEMGYPGEEDELHIMRRREPHQVLDNLEPVLTAEEVVALQDATGGVHVDESVASYMLAIIRGTREADFIELGASPRAAVSFYEACQARAMVEGRGYVTPDDARRMAVPALAHRIIVKSREGNPLSAARSRARAVVEVAKRIAAPE
jgi:MoxR-like ATPase